MSSIARHGVEISNAKRRDTFISLYPSVGFREMAIWGWSWPFPRGLIFGELFFHETKPGFHFPHLVAKDQNGPMAAVDLPEQGSSFSLQVGFIAILAHSDASGA